MQIRFDHIVVVLVVLTVFISGIYLIETMFSGDYDTEFHKYDAQFRQIESAINTKDYQRVVALASQILRNNETGINEIRAKASIGLAKLQLGETEDAINILQYLIDKYPGIKFVYAGQANGAKNSLLLVYTSILTDYVTADREAVEKKVSLLDIFNAMDFVDWLLVISMLIASVTFYERLRKRTVDKTSKH